jgi:hypothetical protein
MVVFSGDVTREEAGLAARGCAVLLLYETPHPVRLSWSGWGPAM